MGQLSRCVCGPLSRTKTSVERSLFEWERKRRVKADARLDVRSGGCGPGSDIARSNHAGRCSAGTARGHSGRVRRVAVSPMGLQIKGQLQRINGSGFGTFLTLASARGRITSRDHSQACVLLRKFSSSPRTSPVCCSILTRRTPLGRPVESKNWPGKQPRMLWAICRFNSGFAAGADNDDCSDKRREVLRMSAVEHGSPLPSAASAAN